MNKPHQQHPTISTRKPHVRKVRVMAMDAETRKSKSVTVYDATPEQVIAALLCLASHAQ